MRKESLSRVAEVLQATVMRAGRLLRNRIDAVHQITHKGEIDLVTEMDRAVESLFVKTIRRVFPQHEVLSEEMEHAETLWQRLKPTAPGRFRWIIDPVDGTTNYAHRYPHFCVSAGIEQGGRVVLGAVYNPMLREFFFSRRGQGAWRNGRRIRVSGTRVLKNALLGTGFPYDLLVSRQNNFKDFYVMSRHCQAVRRAGSAALDLCDVACGRFDGFWEYRLKPWDTAAGSLMIEEAGGRMSTISGRPFTVYQGSIIASNAYVHASMLTILKQCGNEDGPPSKEDTHGS